MLNLVTSQEMISRIEKEKANTKLMEEETQIPDPPEFMSYEAKCEFLRCIEDLVSKGIYVGVNIGIFENYCIAIGFVRECEQNLAEDGKIIAGKPHPAFKMMLDAMSSARASWESLKPKKLVSKEEEDEENNWKKDKGLLA